MTVTLEWQFEDPHAVASGKGDTDTADAPRNSTSGRRHYAANDCFERPNVKRASMVI